MLSQLQCVRNLVEFTNFTDPVSSRKKEGEAEKEGLGAERERNFLRYLMKSCFSLSNTQWSAHLELFPPMLWTCLASGQFFYTT